MALNIDEHSPRTASQMHEWSRGWHARLRKQAYVLEMAAAETRGRLSRAKGLDKIAAKVKARRVAARIRRASRLCEAAASEIAKAQATFLREYGEHIPGSGRRAGQREPFKLDA